MVREALVIGSTPPLDDAGNHSVDVVIDWPRPSLEAEAFRDATLAIDNYPEVVQVHRQVANEVGLQGFGRDGKRRMAPDKLAL